MKERSISQGLDYYKPTMSQLEYEQYPDAEVAFTLKNRSEKLLSQYVSAEQFRDSLTELQKGWQPEEIAYLASLTAQDGSARFSKEYLDAITDTPLPPVQVGYDERGDLAVTTTGKWPMVTFWETVIMSELNEQYFANKLAAEGGSLEELYREGNARLSAKIARLQQRPDIHISDFGTRRRFSYRWHEHVVERLAIECPENFVGTSNVYLAHKFNLPPIGTFAHELPMVYAALADSEGKHPLGSHRTMLNDWRARYPDLSIALSDTFTSDFFFSDFTHEQATQWRGLRHDSGDPYVFTERAIAFYEDHDIDPRTKMIVFSDGLDIDSIVHLADTFNDRIQTSFGWGTTLTNDLGVAPNNFVMKATAVNGEPTVKLSDTPGKHTGPPEKIAAYQKCLLNDDFCV